MDSIFRRRSIRKYSKQPGTDDDVRRILEAAMAAPSAGDERPWHFIVVRDQEAKRRIAEGSPYAKMVPDASVAIVVCGDTRLERHKGYWVQDCSAATENILISAADLDLGAVWLGIYPVEDRVAYLQRLFSLPESVIPLSVVPVGHPAERKDEARRYDDKRVHREKW